MPSSFQSPQQQFTTARHSRPVIGDFGDDTTSKVNGMGAAYPVHNAVQDVAPYSTSNNSTVNTMTSWRTHRSSANALPPPLSKRTQGSFVKFE